MPIAVCGACEGIDRIHHRHFGLCDTCYAIWQHEEQTRREALDAAIQHLYSFGLGQMRIAYVLNVTRVTVRNRIKRELSPSERRTLAPRERPPPAEQRSCVHCKKPFWTRDQRPGRGKYCSLTCYRTFRLAKHPEVHKLLHQGLKYKEVGVRVGLSEHQVEKIAATYRSDLSQA